MKRVIVWLLAVLCFVSNIPVSAEGVNPTEIKIEIYTRLPDHGNLRAASAEITEDSSPDFRRGSVQYRGNGDSTYNITVELVPVGEKVFHSEAEVMKSVIIDGNTPESVELLEHGGANVTGVCYAISGRHADQLYRLGLAKGIGTGADGRPMFDLAAGATRAEAVAMLVRLLGEEAAAAKYGKTHPFTDVPSWADGYVSLAYTKGLAKGVSETLFDADSPISREMFLTFLLRVLNYSEGEDGDFVWNDPYALAMASGIWRKDLSDEIFLRKEMFNSAFYALFAYTRTGKRLCDELISNDVFNNEEWETAIYEPEDYDEEYKTLRSRTVSELSRFENAYFNERGPFYVTVLQGINNEYEKFGSSLCLIYNANYFAPQSGEKCIFLPLPQADLSVNAAEAEDCRFSDDYTKFLYSCTFAEDLTDGENLIRKAGTYFYTTDLKTGITSLEILPVS